MLSPPLATQRTSRSPKLPGFRFCILAFLALALQAIAEWTLPAESTPDLPLFGEVVDIRRLHDGRTAILDRQQLLVVLLDAQGKHLETIPIGGEGPGETTSPMALVEFPAGRVSIVSMGQIGLALLGIDGHKPGHWEPKMPEGVQGSWVEHGASGGGALVLCVAVDKLTETESHSEWLLLRWDAPDALPTILMRRSESMGGSSTVVHEVGPTDALEVWDVDRAGQLLLADRHDALRVQLLAADATPTRVDELPDYQRVPRSAERLEALRKRYTTMIQYVRGAESFELAEFERDVRRVNASPDGGYYVVSSQSVRRLDEGENLQLLRWSKDGKYEGPIDCKLRLMPQCDQYWISGDHVYVLRGGLSSLRAARRTSAQADAILGEDPCAGSGRDGDLECHVIPRG